MTGLQLQSVILGKGLQTRIIFITAFPEEADRAKPFDGKTMIKSLAAALNGHSNEKMNLTVAFDFRMFPGKSFDPLAPEWTGDHGIR